MISYEEALETILSKAAVLGTEEVVLQDARGRYLAEDVIAPFDGPRFDNSAVDGYAVKVKDVDSANENSPVSLHISGQVRAGDKSLGLESGCAVSIFTGAPVHASHEVIVMKEFTRRVGDRVSIMRSARRGENIRRSGEEYRKGDRLLETGADIASAVCGVLASVGKASVRVCRLPRITLIVSGNELVDAGGELTDGKIYNSNSIALRALLEESGVFDVRVQRCSDALDGITSSLKSAIESSDVAITVGGASVGDYDFVAEAARLAGITIHHDRVALKPGKPNLFGTRDEVLFFGLPGNPVSAFVSTVLFVRPAIKKMMGAGNPSNKFISAVLGSDLRKKAGRLEFVRVKLEAGSDGIKAVPVKGQDSHMMLGLAKADGLLVFDREKENLIAGGVCRVMVL